MKTICPNLECLQEYHVKSEALGKLTRCRQCNTVFTVEAMPDPIDVSELFAGEDAEAIEEVDCATSGGVGIATRRKTKDIIADQVESITRSTKNLHPVLLKSYEQKDNESQTRRLVIDRILTEVLGYTSDDIATEYKVCNDSIDYVLSVKGEPCILVEAKAITKPLGKTEENQAKKYGTLTKIKWVILTNGIVWRLYRISDDVNSKPNLVFTVELLDGLDEEEASHLYLISKHGMSRQHLLEKRWQKISALSPENLTAAILSDEVINKIRITLNSKLEYKVTNEEIRQTLLARNLID